MVVQDGLRDVSIQQVADCAGVAHRTVYRHFASRQDLIDQLAEWLQERGIERGEAQSPHSVEAIPSLVERNARLFDQDAELRKALVLVTWESGAIADLQHQRTEMFDRVIDPLTGHLNPEHARAVSMLIRYLASSRTWLAFRDEAGLSGAETGPVVGWAIQLMIDALRDPASPQPGELAREETHDDGGDSRDAGSGQGRVRRSPE
jgi:AcrR family transcriptional regulator